MMLKHKLTIVLAALAFSSTGCSTFIANRITDKLTSGPSTIAQDTNVGLVCDSLPVFLKSLDTLHEATPHNPKLLLAMAGAYTQYGYACKTPEVDHFLKTQGVSFPLQERVLRTELSDLFKRARLFALEGLGLKYPNIGKKLLKRPYDVAILNNVKFDKSDAPFLYWLAVSWALTIDQEYTLSISKPTQDDFQDDTEVVIPPAPKLKEESWVGDQIFVERLTEAALAADESYGNGQIHEFYIAYPWTDDKSKAQVPAHFERAMVLSKRSHLGALVTYAKEFMLPQKDLHGFLKLLDEVIMADINNPAPQWKENRLANTLAQRKAAELRAQAAKLFPVNAKTKK